jgi:hypothetical protein
MGLPPLDLRSLCPLSSTEFVEPTRKKFLATPTPQKKILCTPLPKDMSGPVQRWLLFYSQRGADKNMKYICQFKKFNKIKINNIFP